MRRVKAESPAFPQRALPLNLRGLTGNLLLLRRGGEGGGRLTGTTNTRGSGKRCWLGLTFGGEGYLPPYFSPLPFSMTLPLQISITPPCGWSDTFGGEGYYRPTFPPFSLPLQISITPPCGWSDAEDSLCCSPSRTTLSFNSVYLTVQFVMVVCGLNFLFFEITGSAATAVSSSLTALGGGVYFWLSSGGCILLCSALAYYFIQRKCWSGNGRANFIKRQLNTREKQRLSRGVGEMINHVNPLRKTRR